MFKRAYGQQGEGLITGRNKKRQTTNEKQGNEKHSVNKYLCQTNFQCLRFTWKGLDLMCKYEVYTPSL